MAFAVARTVAQFGMIVTQSFIITLGGCLAMPAQLTIISKAVRQDEQAMIQAAFILCGSVSKAFANPVYTKLFFNTNAKGWAVVSFIFWSGAINCIAMVVISVTFYFAVYLPEQEELGSRMTSNAAKARLAKDGAVAALLGKSADYRSWTSDDYRRQNPGNR